MLARRQDEDSASYRPFREPAELHDLLLDDLAVLLTSFGQRMSVESRSLGRMEWNVLVGLARFELATL
jgi:hypothetical protein